MKDDFDNGSPGKTSHSGGRKKTTVIVLLFSLTVAVLAAVMLCAAVFSPPETVPFAPPEMEDLYLQQRLVRRLTDEVFRRNPKRESQIVLTEREVNSLFRLADCGLSGAKRAGRYSGPLPRTFRPVFRDGRLHVVCPVDTNLRVLFGGVLRIGASLTPDFEDARFRVTVHECRAGALPLSSILAEKFLLDAAQEMQNAGVYAAFCGVVKKASVTKEGNVILVYSPAQFLPLILRTI